MITQLRRLEDSWATCIASRRANRLDRRLSWRSRGFITYHTHYYKWIRRLVRLSLVLPAVVLFDVLVATFTNIDHAVMIVPGILFLGYVLVAIDQVFNFAKQEEIQRRNFAFVTPRR